MGQLLLGILSMKNIRFVVITLLVIVALYWLPDAIYWFFNHQRLRRFAPNDAVVQSVFDVFGVLVWVFALLALTYKKYWSPALFKHKGKAVGFVLIGLIFVYVLGMSYSFSRQMGRLYDYYKAGSNLQGRVFEADAELGHHGIPNSSGFHSYTIDTTRKQIPIFLDSLGFRTAAPQFALKSDTSLLFLGCSFTWGDFCPAEKTYSYRVSQGLNSQYINAGTSAYGLAQMLILAREYIPKQKPKIVFVQYSPWLADRARFTFYPSAFGIMPFPFIYRTTDGFDVHRPFFASSLYQPESAHFKQTARSFSDKLAFVWQVGLPVVVKDYFKQKWAFWQMSLGTEPRAESNNQAIERYVYEEIAKICQENGTQLVVVNLGGFGYDETRFDNHYDRTRFQKTVANKNLTFIDVDSSLRAGLKTHKEYDKYLLWDKTGKDSVLFDNHPNANTHRLIAEQILLQLNKTRTPFR